MDILYNEISTADLEAIHINRMMIYRENGVNNLLFVFLMRRYTINFGSDNIVINEKTQSKGKNVTPTRKLELATITILFESVTHFTPMHPKLTDNWLRDSYNKSKVKVNDNVDCILSVQKGGRGFQHTHYLESCIII